MQRETIRSRVGYLFAGLTGSTLGKVWALRSLRYELRPLATAPCLAPSGAATQVIKLSVYIGRGR